MTWWRQSLVVITALLVGLFSGIFLAWGRVAPTPSAPQLAAVPVALLAPPSVPLGAADLRWLAVGGGALPELNQISIQQNLQRWSELYADEPGQVLAASGSGTRTVQRLAEPQQDRDLRGLLGDLLLPKAGRETVYQSVGFERTHGATRPNLIAALRRSLLGDGPLLTLFLTGHGDLGTRRQDTSFGLWLADEITVEGLAESLDGSRHRRPLRAVVTSCYSGGFAELAFAGADASKGASERTRCGLFATSHDRVASGCDPNPDRSVQQGYGKYLFEALSGAVPVADLDRDGRVSLLEAHTWVRFRSQAADLPTTTSERWLEVVAPQDGAEREVELPEEDWLIARLEAKGVQNISRVQIQRLMEELQKELDRVQVEVDRSWRALAAPILARWPELDDPWHPDFAAALASAQATLNGLETLELTRAYGKSLRLQAEVLDRRYAAQAGLAPLERWEQARATRGRARRLAALGGPRWDHFKRLRSCEASP